MSVKNRIYKERKKKQKQKHSLKQAQKKKDMVLIYPPRETTAFNDSFQMDMINNPQKVFCISDDESVIEFINHDGEIPDLASAMKKHNGFTYISKQTRFCWLLVYVGNSENHLDDGLLLYFSLHKDALLPMYLERIAEYQS
jgi:hypothetical protein